MNARFGKGTVLYVELLIIGLQTSRTFLRSDIKLEHGYRCHGKKFLACFAAECLIRTGDSPSLALAVDGHVSAMSDMLTSNEADMLRDTRENSEQL